MTKTLKLKLTDLGRKLLDRFTAPKEQPHVNGETACAPAQDDPTNVVALFPKVISEEKTEVVAQDLQPKGATNTTDFKGEMCWHLDKNGELECRWFNASKSGDDDKFPDFPDAA